MPLRKPRSRRTRPLFTLLALALLTPAFGAAEIEPDRKAELIHMLKHDCGSCHGMTMKGGLGPSLLPEALAGKDSETLAATVLYGRANTPMPPWRFILDEEEASWLISVLKQGISDAH